MFESTGDKTLRRTLGDLKINGILYYIETERHKILHDRRAGSNRSRLFSFFFIMLCKIMSISVI